VVRTYHYALKFMPDQRLSTILQHAWGSKLSNYDFSFEYLQRDEECTMVLALYNPSFILFNNLRR
jgi:hypothetical protein